MVAVRKGHEHILVSSLLTAGYQQMLYRGSNIFHKLTIIRLIIRIKTNSRLSDNAHTHTKHYRKCNERL